MNIQQALSPETSTLVIRTALSQDPQFARILNDLRIKLPKNLVQQAEVFEEWVLDAVMDELKSSIEAFDSVALAKALLSNKALQGKLAVPLNGIAMSLSERIKADIKAQIESETQQIHNLLAARRAKERADQHRLMKQRDELKLERDVAIAKGELLWLKISALPVAVPALTIALIIGVLIGVNYPLNVLCHKGDFICGFRLGAKIER